MSLNDEHCRETGRQTSFILLGAGTGTRLSPYTDAIPKWNLPIRGNPLIQYLIAMAHREGISRATLLRRDGAVDPDLPCIEVRNAGSPKNMVGTLFEAEDRFGDDCIVSYSDILYEPRLLNAICNSDSEISVVVDLGWEKYFQMRDPDVRSIAETMDLKDGRIISLGRSIRPDTQLPQGQYIGLLRFRDGGVRALRSVYHDLRSRFSGRPWRGRDQFESAYMTDFLQELIDRGFAVTAVPVVHGWVEFDTQRDYEIVIKPGSQEELAEIIDLDSIPLLPTVLSAGGVALRRQGDSREVLLVSQGERHDWRLPKGMQERGEEIQVTANREVLEETGVECDIRSALGTISWVYTYNGRQWQEICYFFRLLPKLFGKDIVDPDIHEARWMNLSAALSSMAFPSEREIVQRALLIPETL